MKSIELFGEVASITFRGGSQIAEILLCQRHLMNGYQEIGTIHVRLSREQAEYLTENSETQYLKITMEAADVQSHVEEPDS